MGTSIRPILLTAPVRANTFVPGELVSWDGAEFASYFLDVFGQPGSATACECERSQEANLAQSLHLLNSAEVQGKLERKLGELMDRRRDELVPCTSYGPWFDHYRRVVRNAHGPLGDPEQPPDWSLLR